MAKPFVIGGEFLYGPEMPVEPVRLTLPEVSDLYHPHYQATTTGGGYYSLKLLLKHLTSGRNSIPPALLPSYLCPSLLRPFRELNIAYDFYPVDEFLRPCPNTLAALAKNHPDQIILVIPYFGFDFSPETRAALLKLKSSGNTLIEDRAQCLFPDFAPVGDYLFYSFRKFLPLDGSLLLSPQPLIFHPEHFNETYLELRRAGQTTRYQYFFEEKGTPEHYLDLFHKAEEAYHQPGMAGMDQESLIRFERTDLPKEIKTRRCIFETLHDALHAYCVLKSPDTGTSSPLCYPVRVKNPGNVREILAANNIFAPIHWIISLDEVPQKFTDSHNLSCHTLSLPIRSDSTEEEVDSMIRIFLSSV